MTSRSERCSIGSHMSNSSLKPCQRTQYYTWPHTRQLLMIFSTTKNSSSVSSSSMSIWSSGCSRNGLRRKVWITLCRRIQSGVSTSYACDLTFCLSVKGPMYSEVSVRLFPDLIVKLHRSTNTLSLGLYDRALSKLSLLYLSLIYVRVLWMSS